jgi:hypothetical protein
MMKPTKSVLLFAVIAVLAAAFLPVKARADTTVLIVDRNHTADNISYFQTIQGAINYADSLVNVPTPTTTSFTVLVEPDTYTENITLKSNIPVRGRETARTILSSASNGQVVTASGVTGVSFRNFTITNASLGIGVSNNSTVTIKNNVFRVGTSGTAVQIQSSPSAQVVNNTFYNNGTAVIRDADSVIIDNNIFFNNTTNISQGTIASESNITYNAFFPSTTVPPLGTNYIPNTLITQTDPLFVNAVDTAQFDFHLKAGSPCIDNGDSNITDAIDGTRSDIGAYGGPDADTIPFPLSGVTAAMPTTTSITLNWDPNTSYRIGGYRVYYGSASGDYSGTEATEGHSPITVPTGTSATTFTLSGFNFNVVAPATPSGLSTAPLDGSLKLSWNAVDGATGYKVYYDTVSLPTNSIPVGNVTSYTLSGLTNGQTYYVAVSAYAQALVYLAVTAFDDSTGPFNPGIQHESAYSQEVTAGTGDIQESALSNVVPDFPEVIVPYPDLPNSHAACFIATAAYGYYSEPSVQALRNFRDQYLATNAPGRALVKWYYVHGPAAAAWLNSHPGYKPLVRAALWPAVEVSLFLTKTSPLIKFSFLLIAGFFIVFLFSRKGLSGSGGSR